MNSQNDDFQKRIASTFRIEAEEYMSDFSNGLTILEKNPSSVIYAETVEKVFRTIHSLKGAARAVEQTNIESICQPLESVFASVKQNKTTLLPTTFDIFFGVMKRLNELVANLEATPTPTEKIVQRELINQLKQIASQNQIADSIAKTHNPIEFPFFSAPENSKTENISATENTVRSKPLQVETMRIRLSKLDPLMMQAEELIQAKKSIRQRISELNSTIKQISAFMADSAATMDYKNQTSTQFMEKMESDLVKFHHSLERDRYNLDNMVDTHLESMKSALMLPVSTLTEIFPSMVREISRESNKEIEFVIRGSELEIDKRILDEIKDPLIHLIRNCIDHGIDFPEERLALNKPRQGIIELGFSANESGIVEISLSDDGRGIVVNDVRNAAIKSGTITRVAAEKLNPDEVLNLIFQSGVSTAEIITNISGRGLGLSIVHEKVEKLGGRISIRTGENTGTTFQLFLPMTMATFRGILVKVEESLFILPTINVERVVKTTVDSIRTIENQMTVTIDNKIISCVKLSDVLGITLSDSQISTDISKQLDYSGQLSFAVLVSGEKRVAFVIDEVLTEQQVLVKSLGKLLCRVRNISGVTILETGQVVAVLHVPDLITWAVHSPENPSNKNHPPVNPKIKKILVVDDSLTLRTLIKNILETSGYAVSTAVDGAEAFALARNNTFDLIVSDVDMPNLNGFELTEKIRNDKKLNDIPIILVTTLGSREDHERGIEVGADAYIIKSNFSQSGLIDAVRKLI
jgi:two-component system chemotaxis sensor kinase CheA